MFIKFIKLFFFLFNLLIHIFKEIKICIIKMEALKKFNIPDVIEAGIDEAGRGPLLGRVYAVAVIWPSDLENNEIKDSKKISAKKRKVLKNWIEKNVIDYGIGYSDEKEIDELNILNATYLAMERAINNLKIKPDHLIIDGNRFKTKSQIPFDCIIKGDNTYYSIAAASILAKEYHDEYIKTLCDNNINLDSHYNLISNKGYGTKAHLQGLQKYGTSSFHRKTFVKPHHLN